MPAGFKARGLRIADDAEPLKPGEFRDVDAPGGSLQNSLIPLPFKEPSGTLFNLLKLGGCYCSVLVKLGYKKSINSSPILPTKS